MVIFGTRTTYIKSVESKTKTCPSCGTEDVLICSMFGKYVHIFWIPLFPIGKKGVLQCQHCKYAIEADEMPIALKKEYNDLKKATKTPCGTLQGWEFWQPSLLWDSCQI